MRPAPSLSLPTVTLCAASSVNVPATIKALRHCLNAATFADCLFFTDDRFEAADPGITTMTIERLRSSADYSRFILQELVDHVQTDHVLIVQWDGFILNAAAWQDDFLTFDYIGAPWPQFGDGHDVGNGGFSLRSKRLLEACRLLPFAAGEPEDVAICRTNRPWLEEEHGICFAPRAVADRFAYERTAPNGRVFGFHGVFNLTEAVDSDNFWTTYQTLDERRSVFTDFVAISGQLRASRHGTVRRLRLAMDYLLSLLRHR